MPRYSKDPRWIEAHYPGTCHKAECGRPISRGESAFFYPLGHYLYCRICGLELDRKFSAAAADEDFMNGGRY